MTNNKKKILIVDDEKTILDMTTTYLERKGFYVDNSSNGEEATAMLDSNEYDVILTDIMMAKMDGLTFYKNLKESSPSCAEKVIFMTASRLLADTKSVESTGRPVLDKPFALEDLSKAVNKLLSKKPATP
jgi:CheY-like chemotaxis protein